MKKVYTIGRDLQNDIVIDDPTDEVSRLHATIRFSGRKMFLIDQSQNGTYVNGMRMSVNEEVPITRKDKVSFANRVELDWRLVPNASPDSKKILSYVITGVIIIAAIAAIIWGIKSFLGGNKGDTGEEQKIENVDNSGSGTSDEGIGTSDQDTEETPEVEPSEKDNENTVEENTQETSGSSGSSRKVGSKSEGTTDNDTKTEEPVKQDPPVSDIPLY